MKIKCKQGDSLNFDFRDWEMFHTNNEMYCVPKVKHTKMLRINNRLGELTIISSLVWNYCLLYPTTFDVILITVFEYTTVLLVILVI